MNPERQLRCGVCLHLPPGDTNVHLASPAVTVISGLAVCEAHVSWTILPLHIEDKIMGDHELKVM